MAGEESNPDATRSAFLYYSIDASAGGVRPARGRVFERAGMERRRRVVTLWLTTSGYLPVVRHEAKRRAVRKKRHFGGRLRGVLQAVLSGRSTEKRCAV